MSAIIRTHNPHSKELIKLIEQVSYRHASWQVFSDFIEIAAISLSNPVDWVHIEKRETRYLEIIRGYEKKEQEIFPQMFARLIEALEYESATNGPSDVLGEVFHNLELHNKWKGQFFTPQNICDMMGLMVCGDKGQAAIAEKGFITLNEPACGSGAMILGFAKAMTKQGMNYCKQLLVTAQDIDLKCVQMAYIQLSLYGIPAVVIHANTLTAEEWSRWYTPVYMIDGWIWRQSTGMIDKQYPEDEAIKSMEEPIYGALRNLAAMRTNEPPIQDDATFVPAPHEYQQINLFDLTNIKESPAFYFINQHHQLDYVLSD